MGILEMGEGGFVRIFFLIYSILTEETLTEAHLVILIDNLGMTVSSK